MKSLLIFGILLISVLVVGIGSATDTASHAVEILNYTCSINVSDPMECNVEYDNTIGVCRYIAFTSDSGDVMASVCHKDSDMYEVYRNSYDEGIAPFEICIGDGCIDNMKGFDSFRINVVEAVQAEQDTSELPIEDTETFEYFYKDVSELPITCTPECEITEDNSNGVCRTVTLSSVAGGGDIQICHKGGSRYEIYNQGAIEFIDEVCVLDACIGGYRGFNSLTIVTPNDSDESASS